MSVALKKERDSLDRFPRLRNVCDLQNLLQHEVNYIYPTLSLYRGYEDIKNNRERLVQRETGTLVVKKGGTFFCLWTILSTERCGS